MNTISYHLPRCNSKNLIVNDILKDKGYRKSSIMIPVDSIELPDYVTVGSIYRTTDDELVRYVPERTCKDICEEPSVWEQTRCVFCCSLCGFGFDDYGAHWYYPKVPIEDEIINYCPNCGAKVESE